jgi:aminoacrylate hydrolase
VGHSTGGCIAQVAAAEFPERVGRLILASSWLSADWRFERLFRLRQATLQSEGTLNYARWGAMSNYPPEWVLARRDAMEEAERQAAADSDPGILSARIDAILRFDGRLYASRIEHPATVVCARDDQVTPPHMSEALAAALPQARNVWFDTGGHCFSVVHGEAFAQFISTELAA